MTAKLDGTNGLIQQYDYQVSTTGFSYTFAAGTTVLVMNPAGTLATGTITMPASPADGMTITFSSTQTITALTVNGNTGQTVVGGPTTLLAGQVASFVYRLASTSWFPLQTVPSANTQLGIGQTWQSVGGSRAVGTTYTNSTAKPIAVSIIGSSAGTPHTSVLTISGVAVCTNSIYANTATITSPVSGIVPPGGTYVFTQTSGNGFSAWLELR